MKKTIIFAIIGAFLLVSPVFTAAQGSPDAARGSPGAAQGSSNAPQGFPGGQRAQINDAFSGMDRAFEAEEPPTLADEYYLGRAVAANILRAYKPYTQNTELGLYLNRICQTLVINSPQPEIFNGYHVMILDSREFNAFATPGGHIFLTRELIGAAPSEDALAAIIAHELAHIILKHGMSIIDDMSINDDMAAAANQAAAFAGRGDEGARRALAFRNSVTGIIDTMLKNGYSQVQEFEADNAALSILSAAAYDPGGLLEMLRVLQKVQGGQSGGFNSTHPAPDERIANVEKSGPQSRAADTRSFRVPRFKNK